MEHIACPVCDPLLQEFGVRLTPGQSKQNFLSRSEISLGNSQTSNLENNSSSYTDALVGQVLCLMNIYFIKKNLILMI